MPSRLLTLVLVLFAQSCSYVTPAIPGTVDHYVDYMNRAAEADNRTWRQMKKSVDQAHQRSPSADNRLRLGLLLSSPNRPAEDVDEGRRILEGLVRARGAGVTSGMRNLANIRLRELAARDAMHRELRDARKKINELLDIESSMENKRQQTNHTPSQ